MKAMGGGSVKTGFWSKARDLEHEELQFGSFSNNTALKLGLRLVEKAQSQNYPVSIDIRKHGQQIFHFACEGTSVDNDEWIKRKSRVADRFGKSSIYIRDLIREKELSIEELFFIDSKEYSAFGGAFPIIVRNTGVIGTVTVSGLPDEQDHELVVSVLREFVSADAESNGKMQ